MAWLRGDADHATPRAGMLQTRELAQVVDGWISAQGATTAADIRGLPAVAGARRLIASTIDQIPLGTSGDMPAWLSDPRSQGGRLDLGDLIQHTVDAMILHGRAYWLCTRTNDSTSYAPPTWQLQALHPDWIQPGFATEDVVSPAYLRRGEPIDMVPYTVSTTIQGRAYLLHIPYLVTVDTPAGTTPLVEAASALRGYVTTERQAASMVDGGTHVGGVLSTAHDITITQAAQWQDAWIAARKTGKIPVLGNGLEYRNEAPNSRDLQMVEARQFNQSAVWALLGIPQAYMGSSLMGGQSSLAYANAQDNRRQFADNCLRAFTTQIEDAVSRLLPGNQRAFFDYTEWEGRADGTADVAQPATAAE